jgi:hypothetical protein
MTKMMNMQNTPDVPRPQTLGFMASLSLAAKETRAAEGYLLELLAWCAFADRSTGLRPAELA